MTERKHSEMIKVWADNKNLVVLTKLGSGWENLSLPSWLDSKEYFLCLPKHEDAVLALLNGGEIQVSRGCEVWTGCGLGNEGQWHRDYWYMDKGFKSRIKPKKQTRYAYFYPNGEVSCSYLSSWELHDHYLGCRGKMITFEVEE